MINTLKNTLGYSGADISIIAYRGIDTPIKKFTLEKLRKKRNELAVESDFLNTEVYKLQKDQVAFQNLANQANADLQSQLESNLDLNGGGITPGSGMNILHSRGGAFQNYQNLNTKVNSISTKAKELKQASSAVTTEITETDEKINKLTGIPFFQIGSLHTISYSSFREKFAVRSLGTIQAKEYTRGSRTLAGTMVFNVFQEHEFLKMYDGVDASKGSIDPRAVMLDQILPFNLLLIFANEYGAYSALHLINVEVASEGQEMSIDQIITHNTMNFYATDMIPMTDLGNAFNSYNSMINGQIEIALKGGATSNKSQALQKIDGLFNPFAKDEDKFKKLLAQSRGLF